MSYGGYGDAMDPEGGSSEKEWRGSDYLTEPFTRQSFTGMKLTGLAGGK